MPQELRRADLDEITAQPLLNYLVALSFTRGKIDFRRNVDLNAIYADLVAAVYHRGYEKHRTFGPIRQMKLEQFERVLEEIGLAAWHGDGRTTSVSEIEQHCHASGVGNLLEAFQDGAKAGVTRLLAAFFFRRQGSRKGGDPTFVFTHKSFGEYLAARRVARAVTRVVKEMKSRVESPDEGWEEREALKHWGIICGPAAISRYINVFLRSELGALANVRACQVQLQSLFGFVLKHGMPMELLHLPSFKIEVFNARNAEEALLVALNACAASTKVLSQFGEVDPTSFGAWFRRIQGQRTGAKSTIAASCLSYLDLSMAYLDIGDFYGADFSHSKLFAARANFANFAYGQLEGADLRRCILRWANLEGCELQGAQMDGASMEGTNLLHASVDEKSLYLASSVEHARLPTALKRQLAARRAESKRKSQE